MDWWIDNRYMDLIKQVNKMLVVVHWKTLKVNQYNAHIGRIRKKKIDPIVAEKKFLNAKSIHYKILRKLGLEENFLKLE